MSQSQPVVRHKRSTSLWFQRIKHRALQNAGFRCQKCGKAGRLECDHITPLVKGGKNTLANVQMLCLACHKIKTRADNASDHRAEWIRHIGAYDA